MSECRLWVLVLLLVASPVIAQDTSADEEVPTGAEEPQEPDATAGTEPESDSDSLSGGPQYGPYEAQEEKPQATDEHSKTRVLLLDTVALGDVGAESATAVQTVLARSLRSLDGLEVIDEADLRETQSDGAPQGVGDELQRARNLVERGREHLLNLALDEAVDSFLSARVILRRYLHWLDDPEQLIITLMGLAESLAAAGRAEEAKAAYREVLTLSPGYVPDPGQVPTKFRSLFEEAAKMMEDVNGALGVSSRPSGATVELDGLTIGETPLDKDGIPDGIHSLHLSLKGYKPVRKTIEIRVGETTELDEELAPRLEYGLVGKLHEVLAGDTGEEDPAVLARKLGRHAGVQVTIASQLTENTSGKRVLSVALIGIDESQPRLFGLIVAPGEEFGLGPELAGHVSEALDDSRPPTLAPRDLGLDFSKSLLGRPVSQQAEKVGTLVRKPLTQPAGNGAHHTDPALPRPEDQEGDNDSGSIFTTWWFWTSAGAVLAAAVGTSLALTLGSGDKQVQDPDRIMILIERDSP